MPRAAVPRLSPRRGKLSWMHPNNIIHFLKNVAMTGGLLQIVGFGAGALSIDNRR